MGMEKDLMKIDDLFKDLKYGEEGSSAGGWSRMKDLLEEEMVGTTAVRRGLSRFLAPLLALLLVGGGALYYTLAVRQRTNTQDVAKFPTQNEMVRTNQNPLLDPVTKDMRHAIDAGDLNSSEQPVHPDRKKWSPVASTDKSVVPAKMPTSLIPKLGAEEQQRTSAGARRTMDEGTNISSHIMSAAEVKFIEQLLNPISLPLAATGYAKVSASPQTIPALTYYQLADHPSESVPPVIRKEKIIGHYDPNTGKKLEGDDNPPMLAPASKATASDFEEVTLPDGTEVLKNKNGYYYKKEEDTISRYMVTQTPVMDERTRTLRKIQIDTVSMIRLERIKYTPIARISSELMPAATTATSETNASAALDASSNLNASSHLVPLDNFRVKSRKLAPNTFKKLKNTTSGFADVFDGTTNWYAALVLGGNVSFGNPGAFGMQAGVAIFYSFAERWAVSAGANFMNKYFPSYSFTDQSLDYDVDRTKIPGGWKYSGNAVAITHNYTVNNINILNVPVYLNYSLTDRLALFGGLNLSYVLPVKWMKEDKIQYQNIETTREDGTNPFVNTAFQIDEKEDFGARFGLGYVGGLSYDISRTMSLDMRIQQSLWNNRDTRLESLNHLFKQPAFGLSFSYYFGRKERIIYILDAHAKGN